MSVDSPSTHGIVIDNTLCFTNRFTEYIHRFAIQFIQYEHNKIFDRKNNETDRMLLVDTYT